jgi:nitrite reductase/ring-hydroxylating ferredoxin subunit
MYDLKTGAAAHSANSRVAVYALRVEGDEVFVQLD